MNYIIFLKKKITEGYLGIAYCEVKLILVKKVKSDNYKIKSRNNEIKRCNVEMKSYNYN